jgi:parvulin-like peptidyl-prolyl isomerase
VSIPLRSVHLAFALAALALAPPLSAPPLLAQASSPGGGFAALVNGEPITYHELEKAVEQWILRRGSQFPPEMLENAAAQLRAETLRELVTEHLLLQRCAREKIEIRPEEVDNAVQQKIEELRSEDESIRTVADFFDRWEADYRENEEQARREIADRLRIQRLLEAKIYRLEYISPAELRAYFVRNREEFSSETTHVFHQILLSTDDPDLATLLEAIDRDVKAGRDFGEMIQEYSQGPRRDEGERYEMTEKQLASWFSPVPETVSTIEIGAVSAPLRTPSRIHIIQVLERHPGRKLEFAECQLDIRSRLRGERQELQRARFEEELRKNADVRIFLEIPAGG